MKFCIDYKRDFKYLNDVDEITIRFRRKDTSLVDFLLEHQKQRINIYIEDEEDFIENNCIELFNAIAEEHPEINFVLKLRDCHDSNVKYILDIIKNNKIKHNFFFNSFVRDWDSLLGIMSLNPSDVYIVENLGFEIKDVAEVAHQENIQIRIFPNVTQSSWNKTPALKQFFIRPEDVRQYDPYVDVMEFFGKEDSIATYYKVYAIDKKWFGKLNEIIIGFEDNDIDSRFILPNFAERRLNCGKRCYKGRRCRMCEAIEGLAEVFENENLIISNVKDN